MYQSITKLPMPPHRPLGIWLFLKGFGQIPGHVGSIDGQIPHRLALQKVSNPALHQRQFMVKNFPHASNRLFKSKFPRKHNRNISRHVASKALKCSNKTVNIGAMMSIIFERDVHAERNADQHFDTKVNARQVGPHFGSNSPLYGKMPGVCPVSGRFWNWLVQNLTVVRSLIPSLAQAS